MRISSMANIVLQQGLMVVFYSLRQDQQVDGGRVEVVEIRNRDIAGLVIKFQQKKPPKGTNRRLLFVCL